MDIDKALNRAPQGVSGLEPEDDEMIEIEIVDPEQVDITIGDEQITIIPGEMEGDFDANLADLMDEDELNTLSSDLMAEFEDDAASRSEWIQTYVDGLELLGLKVEDRSEPWTGACGVYHPLLSEALVKFQAETMMETFPAQGPVRTKIIGEETPENIEAARRVKDDMNYELTERMVEYRPEHERMLWGLGLSGNAFKKVYYDPAIERQVSIFVTAEDVVVPYGASNLESAPRVTHVMRKTANELRKLQVAGFYRDIQLDEPSDTLDEIDQKIAEQQGFSATTDSRHKILEMHIELDLPGFEDEDKDGEPTGVALPYVVTLEKSSGEVMAIRRNWNPENKKKEKRNHFVHYEYVPGFGFYAFGLIHLIGAFAKSGTSIIRQLVDAGTLANLPGGFKSRGLRVKGDDTPIAPGEFRDVDVSSGSIKDNLMALPYKEPSTVLYQLLGTIVDEGRRFASAADLKIADMSSESPVGTTLAILERTLKVMSAVQARIHYSMKKEFKLLKTIIRDYTDADYGYDPADAMPHAKQSDYDMVEVIPVSDPNAATMAQKVVQYQAVLQLSQTAPDLYDRPLLHRQMLEVLGIKDANKLVPLDDDMKPKDPVSENMAIINMKPVKAFIYQDHEAHIQVHMAAMQDPKIAAIVGQSPNAQALFAAASAHIQEHVAFEYRKQVQDAAGVPYPGPDAEMDEATEVEISRLAAAAAQKVLQGSQAEAAQEAAQEAAEDPIVQMQQAELEIKKMEMEIKKQKLIIDAAGKRDSLEIERERIAAQERMSGLQVGARVATDKEKLTSKEQAEGLRLGIEVAREASEAAKRQQEQQQPPQPFSNED